MKFHIGSNASRDFTVFADDGKDITNDLSIKSLHLDLEANEHTVVRLEVYPDSLEILTDHVEVSIVPHPQRSIWQRLQDALIGLRYR